jgi:hypothetical protein
LAPALPAWLLLRCRLGSCAAGLAPALLASTRFSMAAAFARLGGRVSEPASFTAPSGRRFLPDGFGSVVTRAGEISGDERLEGYADLITLKRFGGEKGVWI